jgi:hypothetical protein
METIEAWLTAKAAVIFAAASGAAIHVAIFWSSPKVMIRQFIACVLFGINFGPAFFGLVTHYTNFGNDTYFSIEAVKGATICATGLCGVYLTEGFVALAKRWSSNPQLPWKKP